MKKRDTKIPDSADVVVFDMDGTLYELDGENGTIKNSTLMKTVVANSIEFVIARESCERAVAEKIIELGLADEIGISNVLSKRYGITRADYFDVAWDIDPREIIKDYEDSVETVRKLKQSNRTLILLTAAPRIWMENVIKVLMLGDHFDRKINGEMFQSKTEIFEKLAIEFDPKKVVSVGDQVETDINPAEALGMNTFKVTKPKDLLKLM